MKFSTALSRMSLPLLLSACGGGGSDAASQESFTYFQLNTLNWSSPTSATYGHYDGVTSTPSFICSGSINGQPSNFNKQDGWRTPTTFELQELFGAANRPAAWKAGQVWAQPAGTSLSNLTGIPQGIDLATGQYFSGTALDLRARVVCVKPV